MKEERRRKRREEKRVKRCQSDFHPATFMAQEETRRWTYIYVGFDEIWHPIFVGIDIQGTVDAQVITWASFVHKSCRSSRFAQPESNVSHREFNLPHQSGVKLKVLIIVFPRAP